jgi:phage FluMu protein Com
VSPKTRDKRLHDNQMVETQEMHCQGCGRFLGYQAIIYGVITIKCRNCKQWNTIDIRPDVDFPGKELYNRNGRQVHEGRQRPTERVPA